jgi:cytochrome c553
MNRILFFLLILAIAGFSTLTATAQITRPTTDVLGAHLNYGRGCAACHAPHSGPSGNGKARALDTSAARNPILWGEDVSSLYGRTITTGGGKYVEVLPSSMSGNTPDVSGMLTCLSCHDGNFAPAAMMKNKVYETLPSTYGNPAAVPTLIGSNAVTAGSLLNAHRMGLTAAIHCGGSDWDCANLNGSVSMRGAKSSHFLSSYGFFVKPGVYNNQPVVVCTTCHEPHVMNVVTVTSNSNSGLPAGNYATMFFLRAPYNPRDTSPDSNQTAQFCRQCHGDKSNEMNGSTAGTTF